MNVKAWGTWPVSAALGEYPTPTHDVALKQLIPRRALLVVAGLGVVKGFQVPVQVSAMLIWLLPKMLIPTTAQKARPTQETPVKVANDPEGIVGVVKVQLEPFQTSASGSGLPLTSIEPTSMHADGAPQDTLNAAADVAPLGTGRLVIVQDEPFHCSVIGALSCAPAAMHHETERHETLVSNVVVVVEAFTRTTDQEEPFHCSIRGDSPPPKSATPTAMQNEVVTQETSVNTAEVEPVTVGSVSSGDHVVPFHVCAW